jgi:hypothetical protein
MVSAGFKPAILGTRGQHANHKTTEAAVLVSILLRGVEHVSWSSLLHLSGTVQY